MKELCGILLLNEVMVGRIQRKIDKVSKRMFEKDLTTSEEDHYFSRNQSGLKLLSIDIRLQ